MSSHPQQSLSDRPETVGSLEEGSHQPLAARRYGSPPLQSRLFALAIIALLGVWLSFLFRHYLSDSAISASQEPANRDAAQFARDSYVKTDGDFNKLSEDEKNRFRRIAGVHAEELFRSGKISK